LGHFLVLKFPNLEKKCLWAKVLIYLGSILGDVWTKLGAFFTKRQVTLIRADRPGPTFDLEPEEKISFVALSKFQLIFKPRAKYV
jgi:hypothetical protein